MKNITINILKLYTDQHRNRARNKTKQFILHCMLWSKNCTDLFMQ